MKIAITMGDAAGIGAEIIVKALANRALYEQCIPIVIGDASAMEDALRFTNSALKLNLIDAPENALGEYGKIDIVDFKLLKLGDWKYKTVNALTGGASFMYVTTAIEYAIQKRVDAVATGPINKEAINLAGHHYAGHTEIFAHYTNTADYAMLLSCRSLRVIHVTTHVSMEDACRLIKTERVLKVIKLADYGARLLGVEKPCVGVAGFNAHSSENGLFGAQEAEAIIPAIELARNENINVEGPVPPDTVFVKALSGKYDIVVAMYHDQGHIPLKLCGFKMDPKTGIYSSMSGINCTLGLPFIRSSVDHGTAFGKAGDGRANEESMVEAIEAAYIMTQNMRKIET